MPSVNSKGGNVKPQAQPSKGRKSHSEGRKILYPHDKPYTEYCVVPQDKKLTDHMKSMLHNNVINSKRAQELLKWEEEDDDENAVKFGSDYLLKDRNGRKIRCGNNLKNRPLYMGNVEDLVQEHLQKRWRFNFEPIIIGETGLICNGQHSLVSLILAEQDRTGKNSAHWFDNWSTEVTMAKAIAFGCLEDDETINSMDTAKPRTLQDVIYRSAVFKDKTEVERKRAARLTEHALRALWHRTGVSNVKVNKFSGRRTHAAYMSYVNRHPHLIDAVAHILVQDVANALKLYIQPGQAAAVLYLMGCSDGDGDEYHNQMRDGLADERSLDWGMWDKACEFWTLMCNVEDKTLRPVQEEFGHMNNGDKQAPRDEKLCLLAKAWKSFKSGKKLVRVEIRPERKPVTVDGAPMFILDDEATFDGIDLGEPSKGGGKEEATNDREEPKDPKVKSNGKDEGQVADEDVGDDSDDDLETEDEDSGHLPEENEEEDDDADDAELERQVAEEKAQRMENERLRKERERARKINPAPNSRLAGRLPSSLQQPKHNEEKPEPVEATKGQEKPKSSKSKPVVRKK